MESFLEEELKRIHELTRKMSSLQARAAEWSREMARDREQLRRDPLSEVRDLRTVNARGARAEADDLPPRTTPRRRRRPSPR